jgi:flagellar basal-body rod protein FlgG
VNTTAYKKERLEFKSLLYQTLQMADLDPINQMGSRPVNLQVGLGVRPIATARMFDRGSMQVTDNRLDFCIDGYGFFVIETERGTMYTRDGNFKVATSPDGNILVTSDGYTVRNTEGEMIIFPPEVAMSDVSVDYLGMVRVKVVSAEGVEDYEDLTQIDIVQFTNPQGLEAVGGNLFRQTIASGGPIQESSGEVTTRSQVYQGVLEMPNVQIAEEMVRLIIAQRAYEMNSKVITTSDEMLQIANNLKR